MKYELYDSAGRLLGTMTGLPEAVFAARALAERVGPVSIPGYFEPGHTAEEFDAWIEAARRLVAPA